MTSSLHYFCAIIVTAVVDMDSYTAFEIDPTVSVRVLLTGPATLARPVVVTVFTENGSAQGINNCRSTTY